MEEEEEETEEEAVERLKTEIGDRYDDETQKIGSVQVGWNTYYLRNKTCFPCLHSLVKTEANVWENLRADQ